MINLQDLCLLYLLVKPEKKSEKTREQKTHKKPNFFLTYIFIFPQKINCKRSLEKELSQSRKVDLRFRVSYWDCGVFQDRNSKTAFVNWYPYIICGIESCSGSYVFQKLRNESSIF